MDSNQRAAFEDELDKMILNCKTALSKKKFYEAAKSWKKIFGNRFPKVLREPPKKGTLR